MAIRWRTIRKFIYDAFDDTNDAFGVKTLLSDLAVDSPTLIAGQNEALEHTLSGATDETIALPDGTRRVKMTATTVGATYVRYALDEAAAVPALTTSFTTGGVLLVNVPVTVIVSDAGTSTGVLHLRGTNLDVIVVEVW